jgi:hypothetical protein
MKRRSRQLRILNWRQIAKALNERVALLSRIEICETLAAQALLGESSQLALKNGALSP